MRFVPIITAAASLCLTAAANAAIIADFELNGSLANTANTAATLVNNAGAGSLGATGITFAANTGPTILGLAPTSHARAYERGTGNSVLSRAPVLGGGEQAGQLGG